MLRGIRAFTLIDLLVAGVVVTLVVVFVPPAYRKYQAISANSACMAEVEAYAKESLHSLQQRTPPGAPRNVACTQTTDASAGGNVDTDIFARPRPPGTGTITCDLNVAAACKQN